jgi:demethylmenaquinone methyltransferase/2-methoxy-6-polyprenyl-1,4-benzoquinol methylase
MAAPEFGREFLAAQQEYYRARAPEYDEWWERRGRYDHGPEANGRWFREQDEVYAALADLQLTGDLLELACGTGNWTTVLAATAERLTAVDGSAEMLELNRGRVNSERVDYVQADLFQWQPEREYDAVVAAFWLSHVPPERLDGFLAAVRRALRPGGCFFFVDSQRDPLTTTADQPLPEEEQAWLTRRLNDGREFRIVKRFYDPADLRECLQAHGLRAEVRETESFFLYGWALATP